MSKPLLSKSRYNNLLTLVMPPRCEWYNAIIASERFELTEEQRKGLEEAIWLMYRYYTKTMTEEDKALLAKQGKEEFEIFNYVTDYKWY